MKKGFTLIELLIVIAILGIVMGITLIGIDPLDKINAANDSKIQRDVGAIATAEEIYAVNNNGAYAATQDLLVTSGNLKVALVPPSGYTGYTITVTGGAGTGTGMVYGQLKSKKFTTPATPAWVWCSASGKAGATANATTCP